MFVNLLSCSLFLLLIPFRLSKLRPQSVSHFWITSRKPYKAVSPTMMSGWLQDVIMNAGFQEGSARDVRSVGASVGVQSNLDIRKILEVAN